MFGRRNVAAFVAEFLGAGILTAMILSVQHSGIGYPFFVAAAAGLSVVLLSFAVGDISGGQFNPAITFGQWTVGKISTIRGILYIIAQALGAWAAYYLYIYLVKNHLSPIGGHFTARIFWAEAVGTAIFAFAFTAAVFRDYSRPVIASFCGLGLMIGAIVASSGAIGVLNPAVANGIRALSWAYVLGPLLGAFIGTQLYAGLFTDSTGGLLSAFSMAATSSSTTTVVASKPKTTKKKTTKKKK